MTKKVYIFNGNSRAAIYGIGTYIDQLIYCLKNSDIEFEIIYLYGKGKEVSISENDGYRQISIPKCRISGPSDESYYSRSIVYLLKEFIPVDRNREYIFHLNFMGNETLVKYLKKMFRCKLLLVVHYTNWGNALLGDYSRLLKIYKLHTKKTKDLSEKYIMDQVKKDLKIIKKVDRFICVASHSLNVFQKLLDIPDGKSAVIHNALIDTYHPVSTEERKLLRNKYHIFSNSKVIVFVGRLDEIKGTLYLIRAFKKTLVDYPDSYLFILGDGNFSECMKEAENCWSKIIFLGRLEKEKVYDFYKLADLGVVCSLHEEFGFVAIEMMMHALPLIVTKTGGLDEIVEDNISGLKVAVRITKGKRTVDVKSLAEKILYLHKNNEKSKVLGENGRKRFLEKYEITLFTKKMLNQYESI